MSISDEQLAELILGIAKSQNAVIESIVQHLGRDEGISFRSRVLIPVLQGYSNIRNHDSQPTFLDLPSRVLLQLQGSPRASGTPIQEWLAKELTRLTSINLDK